MRKSLYWKLTLAFILVAFTSATLVAFFIRITSADRLSQLIIEQQRDSLEQVLASYYSTNQSWNGIEENWREIQFESVPTPANGETQINPPGKDWPQNWPPNERDRRSFFGLADSSGTVIVALSNDTPAGEKLSPKEVAAGKVITVNDQTVGYILTAPSRPDFNPAEDMFLRRTTQALFLAMVGALLVAITIGILLARTLTRPLLALTHAAQNIAQGKLDQQVIVTSKDEIGQLAESFNQMSQEVTRVNQLRRQMTADIAHDLRTPLTVIGGYIESMRDGVLSPSTNRLSLIYTEIDRLQNLVKDLRMLSQADAGELTLNPQKIATGQLLEHAAEVFMHNANQQNVNLTVEIQSDLPLIDVDEARMMQVMDNLISNALRYTPAGGSIHLGARVLNEMLEIFIKDTGTGIEKEDLPYIFDRFHRVDKSRHAESGESGLGLSIVKALVEAHNGRVWAESTAGEGTTIFLQFPILKD